jgi:predicted nucleotidyltransferase
VAGKKAKRTVEEILRACEGYFSPIVEVEIVYLFGSYAEGNPGLMSDVDLAVLYKRDLPLEQIRNRIGDFNLFVAAVNAKKNI